jgi:hypothetical protein
MTTTEIHTAIERTTAFFEGRHTRTGVLARRVAGHPRREDTELTEHLVRAIRRKTRIDGSVNGSLMDTAWAAWELLELGCQADHAAVVRTSGFMLQTEDRDGHFGEGCDEERHVGHRCRHFLSGFFSPGAWDHPAAPLEFPSGLRIDDEQGARFALSCYALRSVLRAGADRGSAVRRHVDSLLSLSALWEEDGGWAPDLVMGALGALAYAPIDYRSKVVGLARRILGRQQNDGSWTNTHAFHALKMLLGLTGPEVAVAARRAAPALIRLQTNEGAFDPTGNEEQALIALRVLLLAER